MSSEEENPSHNEVHISSSIKNGWRQKKLKREWFFHLLKHFYWLHMEKYCKLKLNNHYHHICCQMPVPFRLFQNSTHIHFYMFFVFVTELNPHRQNNAKLTPFPKALWKEKVLLLEVYAHFVDQCNLTYLHGFREEDRQVIENNACIKHIEIESRKFHSGNSQVILFPLKEIQEQSIEQSKFFLYFF